ITIEIPDNAVEMFVDLVDALRTIAKTVEVETKDDIIQSAEQLKKTVEEEGAKKVKRNLDAFQKLADEMAPKVTLEQVRAKLAELTRNGKREQVKALLNEFGANKLSEVPADKYAELM
ncbi:hypothetical protein JYB64_23500, partial [Algoriphagus aestuarii]|nr:hypothetical protein [Algoriphagus aestuarii]